MNVGHHEILPGKDIPTRTVTLEVWFNMALNRLLCSTYARI